MEGSARLVVESLSILLSFRDPSSIFTFMKSIWLLKPNTVDDIIAINYCSSADNVCHGWSEPEAPFFFAYSYFFTDLHLSFSLNEFTMGVLRVVNVVLNQLHPNSWASPQAFRLICDMFWLRPSTQTFLHFYSSRPTNCVSWLLLTSQRGNILFTLYTSSYKNFKEKFFKIYIESKGREFFYDQEGRPKFPFY